jgi:hypothetical protein
MSAPSDPKYIDFPKLEDGALNEFGEPALNKYSGVITRKHDFPGAQVCPQTSFLKDNNADLLSRQFSMPLESKINRL